MAGHKVSDYGIDTDKWTELLETIKKQRTGYMPLTLTNYSNNSVPKIAAGSYIDAVGELWGFASEEAIGGAAVTANVNYIVFDSATQTCAWSLVAPFWSEDYQGWYDITFTKRYIGGCYFDDPDYQNKWIYLGRSRIMTADIRDDAVHAEKINGLTGEGAVDADNIPVSATKKWLTTAAQTIEGKKDFDGGFIVENRDSDPGGLVAGQMWFRTDV